MDITSITNLGISGFAIWIMWLMYKSSSTRFKEKDQEFIDEIGKRDKKLEEKDEAFHLYVNKVQDTILVHLRENQDVMKELMRHFRDIK